MVIEHILAVRGGHSVGAKRSGDRVVHAIVGPRDLLIQRAVGNIENPCLVEALCGEAPGVKGFSRGWVAAAATKPTCKVCQNALKQEERAERLAEEAAANPYATELAKPITTRYNTATAAALLAMTPAKRAQFVRDAVEAALQQQQQSTTPPWLTPEDGA